MSEKEYKIPTRKWYTLEQAVKRINQLTKEDVDTRDLLQYWMNHKIELCIHFYLSPIQIKINGKELSTDSGTSLYISPDDARIDNYYKNLLQVVELIDDDDYFSGEICVDRGYSDVSMVITIYKNNERRVDLIEQYSNKYLYINGFLSLIYRDELFLGKEIDIIQGRNIPFREGELIMMTPSCIEMDRLFIQILNISDFNLQLDDLYILDDDLEDFLNNRAAPPEPPQKTKEPTTKTLNSQAEFIRNLITIHYGEKVANNIRNELENPRSRITCDFEKNGLKPAAGKAVHRWINQI